MAAVRRAPPWFSRPALSVLVAALAGGCLADSTAPNPPPADQISAVVVSAPSQVLAPGDTIRLTAQVMDANGRVLPNEPVTWSSSNPAAATVDAQGLVTADTVGATTISAVARGKRGTLDFSVQVTVLCDCLKIFDSTDVRLISRNDTTGLYLFRVVQGPPPTLDSADILVGQEDGGYLRKVVSSNLSAGVLTVQTSTAYVEDAVRDGEFATTSFSDDESGTPAPGSTWWGPWTTTYMAPGVSLNQAGFCCSLNGLQASIKFGTRASGTVQFTIVDGEIVFAPRIQLGAKFGFFKLKRFHAIFRGDLGLNLNQYEIKVTAACCSLSDSVQQKLTKESVRFIQQQRPFATFIGPMPIIGRIIKRISLQITPTVAASAIFTGRFRTGFGLTAGARYTSGSGWRPVSGTSSYFDATAPAFSGIEGSASIKIAVVPEFFVEFYGVGGPFVNVEPYAEAAAAVQALFDSNHDYTALDWETRVDLGINLNLGLRLSLMGLTNLEAAFAIPLIQPYRLIQAYSDGDLTVGNLSTGQDIPASYQVQLRPIFTPTDPPLGRKHTTSTQDVVLPANDTIVLPDVRSGPKYTHTLKLTGVQGNCTATNPKLDTMQVNSDLMQTFGGSPTDTLFSVDCIPLGDMQVSAVTNGPDQPARYFVSVKRQDTVGVGKGDSAIVFGIPSGPAAPVPVPGLFLAPVSTDTVLEDFIPVNPRNGATGLTAATLNPGRRNCATARPATNQVVIQSGDTVGTQFAVTCVPLGHIQVLSPTADPDPPPVSDTVRYLPLVVPQDAIDTVASPPGRLVAGDSTIVNGLVPLYNASGAPGRYTVRLSGAPNRCTEAAGFSRTVTVLPG
ncbi:MAG: Ig-like domain-containing protein, partial [Gemmatimonadales bacterium]